MKDFHQFISEEQPPRRNALGLQTFASRQVSPSEVIRTAEQKVARLQALARAAERRGESRRANTLKVQVMDAMAELERLRSRAVSEAAKPTDIKASLKQMG